MVEEKQNIITYKEHGSDRAVKLWDTKYLYEAMQNAISIKHDIEHKSVSSKTSLSDMGLIQISAEDLWFLMDAYTSAYTRLMQEALITSGNISKIQPTIN